MKVFLGLLFFNVINIPVYIFLFRKLFGDKEEFLEALKFSIQPDIISIFKGDFWEDKAAELKLGLMFLLCLCLLIGEFLLSGLIVDWTSTVEL